MSKLKQGCIAAIAPISEPTVDDQAVLAQFPDLLNVLSQLKEHPSVKSLPLDIDLLSAESVSYHLAGLIPLSAEQKQNVLEAFDATQRMNILAKFVNQISENSCLLYTSPSPRDRTRSRMPSSA